MTADIPKIDAWTRVEHIVSDAAGHAVLDRENLIPTESGFLAFPVGIYLQIVVSADAERISRILSALNEIPSPTPPRPETVDVRPSPEYEAETVAQASAGVHLPASASTDEPIEIVIDGPSHGNPFLDVDLVADFSSQGNALSVGGFYDGEGVYRVRFLAPSPGPWSFDTRSNARSLDGIRRTIQVAPGRTSGPVRADAAGFAHGDGTPFVPVGTTAYAWTHQDEEIQRRTLAALSGASFNKLRMGLFPKAFIYNSNEPERFVFPRAEDGSWDVDRFDVNYFRHLEGRVGELAALGIEADLILFHPYDRWGFSDLGAVVDARYVRYVVRRLAAFPHVWWSLANEYELLTGKRPTDWQRIGELVTEEDHVGHPLSIHNIVQPWDATDPWVTHASVQLSDPSIGDRIEEWRHRWGKPVIVDETGYEGDLDQGWGSLPAEELVIRFWQIMLRGGYATHGETFWNPEELIFWSKGGDLLGESPARIGFLRELIEASPTGRVAQLPSQFDAIWGGVADEYVLIHFGRGRPLFRDVPIPNGLAARIAVIDAWNMTVDELPGRHTGTVRVQLPARQHIVIRLQLEQQPK